MSKNLVENLLRTLAVTSGLSVVLIPFSMIVGWNLLTLLLFWFVVTPLLAFYLPTIGSRSQQLLSSLAGLLLFYALIIVMIYSHYQSDYFRIMIVSCIVNLCVITFLHVMLRRKLSV
jgi:hypothetical protein